MDFSLKLARKEGSGVASWDLKPRLATLQILQIHLLQTAHLLSKESLQVPFILPLSRHLLSHVYTLCITQCTSEIVSIEEGTFNFWAQEVTEHRKAP